MNKRFFIFLSIVFSVLFSVSVYVPLFFYVTFHWSMLMFVGVALALFSGVWAYVIGDRLHQYVLKWLGGVVMGGLSIGFTVVTIGFVLLGVGLPYRLAGWGAFFSIVGLLGIGIVNNSRLPKVTTFSLAVEGISKPFTLVQLSDIHLNGLKPVSWVEGMVERVNALSSDMIVFTGDLFDVDDTHIEEHLLALEKLKSQGPKLAVSGNHDFYGGYAQYERILKRLDFELIDHKVVAFNNLYIAGLSDSDGNRFGVARQSGPTVLAQRDQPWPTIVLDHRPEHAKENMIDGVVLQLSGHTHSGQMPPWNVLVRLRYAFAAGFHRYKQGVVYVSRGTGSWGPPVRLFARSEITKIELTPMS